MKKTVFAFTVLLGTIVVGASTAPVAFAGGKAGKASKSDGKKAAAEVTLAGEMVCGMCTLKKTDSCQNVLKVAKDGKETHYFLAHDDVAQKHHGAICSGKSKKATVTGTVKDDGDKKVLTASAITYE